jgi:hypothetical protein
MNQRIDAATQVAASELKAMRQVRANLGRREAYLSTTEAVALCPIDVSEETLIGYPDWILPRVAKNPRARRASWLYDPRDIEALPFVLRMWERAIVEGAEEAFSMKRRGELEERDHRALALIMGRAA